MSDIEFIDGLNAKAPNQNAPEYVKAKISIKREVLIAWLQRRSEEWINAEIKEAKSGKYYAAVDAWRPNSDQSDHPAQRQDSRPSPSREASYGDAATGGFESDDIPFNPIRRRQLW